MTLGRQARPLGKSAILRDVRQLLAGNGEIAAHVIAAHLPAYSRKKIYNALEYLARKHIGGVTRTDHGRYAISATSQRACAVSGDAARLARIAKIIEDVDRRAMAWDGPVPPTLSVMTQREISAIYALSLGKPEGWTP